MMIFDRAFALFMEKHIDESSGLRRQRLLEGLGYGEKLFIKNGWWPAFGNFDYLYPEFMARDYQEGYRFLDHGYLRPPHMLDFESDGRQVHCKDERQFSDDRDRQNFLVLDGWKVFRFSVRKLEERPKECQMNLQQIIGRLYSSEYTSGVLLSPQEQRILEYAGRYGDDFTPLQMAEWMGLSSKQVRTYLHRLTEKGHFLPVSGSERVRKYRIFYPSR